MKGDVTMHVTNSQVIARVSALEEYVGMPQESTGITLTDTLKAQHEVLVAFRAEFVDFRTETNRRLTALEDGMGRVLHGIVEIKNRLPAP